MSIKVNNSTNNNIRFIYGEKKIITYVYNIDVSNAVFEMKIVENDNGKLVKTLSDSELDKSEIDDYKVSYLFDTTKFNARSIYIVMSVTFPNGTKDISDRIYINIKEL
jgi:hypothetical protein